MIEAARPGRRRRYSAEEKRRIVEETRAPGLSVSSVSRRYGMSSSQVFKWRRPVEEGTMSSLVSEEAWYFHDFDSNGDVDNPSAPLAHASLLVRLLAEEFGEAG